MERPLVETMVVTFPEDIFVEILLGLPVKSLLRFKCVCRRWRFLISDRGFTKLHLQRLKARDMIASQRIVKTRPLETIDYEALDHSVSGDDDRALVTDHEPWVNYTGSMPSLVGSCDGLVCLRNDDGYLVYNPTTKECRNLPLPNLILSDKLYRGFSGKGFGYDYRSDDYKIIFVNGDESDDNCLVAIFSLKSGSWRRRKVKKQSHLNGCSQGVYWNGAFHWCFWSGNESKNVILSFDFSEEKFDQVLRVPEVDGDKIFRGLLGVHGDGLFIIYEDNNVLSYEAWIASDHREGGSWTKFFSVDSRRLSRTIVAYTRSQKIVFEIESENMTLLNPEDDTCKDYPIKSNGYSDFAIYLETLVSPYYGCEPSII